MSIITTPVVDVNLFDDPVLAHPYGAYRVIRDAGPAVYLPGHQMWVLSRYQDVRDALRRHLVFSSAHDTGLLDLFTAAHPAVPARPARAGGAAHPHDASGTPDVRGISAPCGPSIAVAATRPSATPGASGPCGAAAGVSTAPAFSAMPGLSAESGLSAEPGLSVEPGYSAASGLGLLRDVLADRFAPRALGRLEASIVNQAEKLVDELVSRGSFDAVADLAYPFPLKTIGDLIGLPADGRGDLMTCAEAALQAHGPMNDHTRRSLTDLEGIFAFLTDELARNRSRPPTQTPAGTGRASALSQINAVSLSTPATERDSIVNLLKAFAMPSIHTTAAGLGSMLWLLATHPEAWHALRATPSLVASAVEESLRLETPVQMFSRVTIRDVTIGDVLIREGERVLLLLGAANRDPRKWTDPDRFNVRRNPTDHLGFGYGTHACIGETLAKIHLRAVLGALVHRVNHLYLDGSPCRRITNTARGFASLPLCVTPW